MRRFSAAMMMALLVMATLFALSAPASASCNNPKTAPACQDVENLICYVFHRCL